MKWAFILLSTLIFAACDQDPLKNAPESIKNNRPPESSKPTPPSIFPKEALQIYAPSAVSFLVTETVEIKITANVLVEGAAYTLSVDNLADFEGASFDSSSGVFLWKPTKSTLGPKEFLEFPLQISLTVPAGEKNALSREVKTVSIILLNSYEKPVLRSLTGPDRVVAGRTYTFQFSVFDSEARTKKELNIQPWDCTTSSNRSLSAMAKVSENIKADPQTPGLYHGEFVLDLKQVQGFSRVRYCVGLMAISTQGKMSTLATKSMSMELPIRRTIMTMDRSPIISLNQKAHFYFSIYDPSGMGELTVTEMADISAKIPGSSWSCDSRPWSKYALQCEAIIVTDNATIGKYYFHLKVRNVGANSGMEFEDNHTMYVEIQ